MSAIAVHDLHKSYDGLEAVRGISFDGRAGRGLRPARPERRRQDDDGRDPRGLPPARRRRGQRARASTRARAERAFRQRIGVVLQHSELWPNLTVRETHCDLRRLLRAAARRGRGGRARRPRREGRRARQDALGRPEAAARPRRRARRRPGAALPRRADDRLRPGGAPERLGDDPLAEGAREDDRADDALPRRGPAARRPRRRPPRGPDRADGHARPS